MKITTNNILIGLIILLFGYIVVTSIFDKDPDINADLKNKVELLEAQNRQLDIEISKYSKRVDMFKRVSDSLVVLDSLNRLEITIYKDRGDALKKTLSEVYKERVRLQKEIETLKDNPVIVKDDYSLISGVKKDLKK